MMKRGIKISILGAGSVGASIAYTLTMDGMASEIVLIDINYDKAKGEAMDIMQGTAFSMPVDIYAGDYTNAANSDIVIVTVGMARKAGQSRIDLAQANVNIIKEVTPKIVKYAPDATYIVVSNPVDIITYTILKTTDLVEHQVIGSGTMLDSARLRSGLAEHVRMNSQNVHAYVFGEHGDTSMIPWSLTTIAGMEMIQYCTHICEGHNQCGKKDLKDIKNDMRTSGSKIIDLKGATYYAIALAVRRLCDSVLRDARSVHTVSSMMHGQYGIDDVCLSLPFVIGIYGILRCITPVLLDHEIKQLRSSADALKKIISSLDI